MEEKQIKVLLCQDSTEGILSAVHMAYLSRYGHKYINIELKDSWEPTLFCNVEDVVPDVAKAESVARAIMEKISPEAWRWVYQASMAGDPGKAQMIYRFLNLGFSAGRSICDHLSNEYVLSVYKLSRMVGRETDKLMGFVRFRELKSGILFSKISPKHQQLFFLGEHFADRLPEENWVIYDEIRHMACIHQARGPWAVARDMPLQEDAAELVSEAESDFADLWKTFFKHIEIRERCNPRLQMNMMPKRFWKHMTEMDHNR
ncbi:MAG TPA: TIGR03915 family putative DNA repair protein [Candidatus Scybalocola faecigallinarum]|uniref:TIGR03915 family putative DNA repair protein n=1 Tax=Candidatus Scybalocola faecigallinarum TaxID=2840941 RepID=A0A9D1F5W5_9FIRM|nr:TIGR03915 family putative DNA repair protein [Candidatus Scybalocola faecigallinarum]